ncbi:hypothetical protein Tco_0980406 [Tanacetum coccineum]
MLGLLDMHWSLLHSNDQISLYCFQAFHCDAIMGQMLCQFQENQRDYFSNDTFRGGVWIWKLYFDGKRDEGDSVGMDVRAADGGVTTREGGVTDGAAVRETVGAVVGRIAAANAAAAISVVNSGGGGI